MESTVSIEEYKAIIEQYIFERKRVKVRIVFDDTMQMRRHFKLLVEAHDIAQQWYKNKEQSL